ncbi:UDP-N-acetylmuramate dehydrogenase [Streptomyces hebeiensis]|uniref:UDP-N-acetylenolpyruvoylglucosamine reductase n=1 Tax=Streptomyces hebeiensis TaxID=229486 RepID=A0ABN1V9K7_9ACTN
MSKLLADHTTLRLGGPVDQWLTHTSPDAWQEVVRAVEGRRPFVLGSGSNTLAADHGYPGPAVRMATRGIAARAVGDDRVEVTVQAGEPLVRLVAYAVAEGLSGVEYLGGIPGTTGAAPVQNAGAYGQQVADRLVAVTAWDWQHGRTVRLNAAGCQFRYRSSVFKAQPGRWTILSVTLHLVRSARAAPVVYGHLARSLDVPIGARPPLAEAAAGVVADRQARGLTLPVRGPDMRQAGSVFLNPPVTEQQAETVRAAGGPVYCDVDGVTRASAGWLLEQCGHGPGRRLAPGVYCSTQRTLTLTARDGATAGGFTAALRTMAAAVAKSTGVQLRPEPVRPALA